MDKSKNKFQIFIENLNIDWFYKGGKKTDEFML